MSDQTMEPLARRLDRLQRESPLQRTGLVVVLALILSTFSASASFGSDPKEEELEKMNYGSGTYEQHREITYWGVAQLTISDYHQRSGDVEYLKLVVKDESSVLPSERPRGDIEEHFFKEVKRFFGDLPFHDVKKGWDERLEKFRQKQGKGKDVSQSFEMFEVAEEVRRRDKYGGRAGALYCQVRVKGRYFPVLYDIRCSISAESNLRYVSWDESNNLDFSSPEHIGGKLKTAITEMLKDRSSWFAKIRKYTKQ